MKLVLYRNRRHPLHRLAQFSLLLGWALPLVSAELPGSVDPTFHANVDSTVAGLSVAPDGKIYVKLGWPSYTTTRLQPDGTPDATFAPGISPGSKINDVALQPDGKIIIAGNFLTLQGVARTCLARLNTDGSVDTNFISAFTATNYPAPVFPPLPPGALPTNSIGTVTLLSDGKLLVGSMKNILGADGKPLPAIVRLNCDGGIDATFVGITNASERMLVAPDGKIILARTLFDNPYPGSSTLYRFNADGTPDPTFVSPRIEGWVNSMFIQSNKLVIAGALFRINGLNCGSVARLENDGTLDSRFRSYVVLAAFGVTIAIPEADGRIMIGGGFSIPGASLRYLARLKVDGSVDTTFTSDADDYVYGLALQPDGKLLVGGEFSSIGGTSVVGLARLLGPSTIGPGRFILDPPRYEVFESETNVTLTVRRIWGTSGVATVGYRTVAGSAVDGEDYMGGSGTLTFPDGDTEQVISIKLINDNSIEDLESFLVELTDASDGEIGLPSSARVWVLDDDGPASLDPTFTVHQGTFDGGITAVASQPNGQILVGGWFQQLGDLPRRGIARLENDGTVDRTFDPGTGVGYNSGPGTVQALRLQADGKILLAGPFNRVNGTTKNHVARLNDTGSLDTTFDCGSGARTYSSVVGDIRDIELTADGQILIGGGFDVFNGSRRHGLVRLSTSGAIDFAFDPAGAEIVVPFGLCPDGRIVFAGFWDDRATRINADGALDNAAFAVCDGNIRQVKATANGRTIIAGSFSKINGTIRHCVARLLGDGSLDTGFVPDLSLFLGAGLHPSVYQIGVQDDDKLIVALQAWCNPAGNYLVRLNSDGTLDTDFEPIRFAIPSGDNETISAIEIQSDHKVVVAGNFVTVNGLQRPYLVRLLGSSTPASRKLTIQSLSVAPALRQISLKVAPGKPFVLQSSTNLIDWTARSTNISPTSAFTFEDLPSPSDGQRYYRVLQPGQ